MRPDPVVVLAPQLDLPPRVVERDDDLLAEAFFAQPRVETLDVRLLDRLARFDELQPNAMVVGSLVEHPAARLGPIVHREVVIAGD